MEFKFRAGEHPPASYFPPPPPPSDGYFTAQALRAGYIGGDLHFRRPEPLPHHPLIPARETLRRELEKERIREEIIAREILRRRELEEEVRRELAMEREFELRRQADRFSLASSSALSERRGVGSALIHDRFAGPGRREVGVVDRALPAESEIRPLLPEVGKGPVVFLGKSTTSVPNLVGIKRKAAASSELKEWTCALCHVHATSEQGLNEHFRGKKHRAKEEELKGSKGIVKNQPVPVLKKIIDQPKIVKKIITNGLNQNLKPMKKPFLVNRPVDQSIMKNQVGVAKKGKFTFVCKQCKVKCNSELMMVAHLGGKKHLTRVQELEATGKGTSAAKAASFKVTRRGDGAAGGPVKEVNIEGESRRTVKEEQVAEETAEFGVLGAMVDEEAEVTEALTDEEEQAMEEQMDDDTEPSYELAEEGSSFYQLEIKGGQD